jgi:hypothetical protein
MRTLLARMFDELLSPDREFMKYPGQGKRKGPAFAASPFFVPVKGKRPFIPPQVFSCNLSSRLRNNDLLGFVDGKTFLGQLNPSMKQLDG